MNPEKWLEETQGKLKQGPEELLSWALFLLTQMRHDEKSRHRGHSRILERALAVGLAFLPEDQLQTFARETISAWRAHPQNEGVKSLLKQLAFEVPSQLHPHLEALFTQGALNIREAYRGAKWQQVEFLKAVVEDLSTDQELRLSAWVCLLHTRNPEVLRYAMEQSPRLDFSPAQVRDYLHWVGFEQTEQGFRQLYLDTAYHIIFNPAYGVPSKPENRDLHPTWTLSAEIKEVAFGGSDNVNCLLCGQDLSSIFHFNRDFPTDLLSSKRYPQFISVCLSCLGWEEQRLFYSQTRYKTPRGSFGYRGPLIKPQFPQGPLLTTRVDLAKTPTRFSHQPWDPCQNLHRLGGFPTWVQGAEYPSCPVCTQTMIFFMQLDSNLPTFAGAEREWLWGSGGLGYMFWCDGCEKSCWLWQCT